MVNRPVHIEVYQEIRALLLFGDFLPGQAVTIHGISKHLGVGITPIREGLRSLIAEGALVAHENRRISVPLMGPDRLADIALLRSSIEPELSRRAVENTSEADFLALKDLYRESEAALRAQDHRRALEYNYRFHFHLYAHAHSPVLERIAQSLWLQSGPAMRATCENLTEQDDLHPQHGEIIRALATGDPEAARRATQSDIRNGIALMQKYLEQLRSAA